jgi:predicted ArsR family transcriptional regulator
MTSLRNILLATREAHAVSARHAAGVAGMSAACAHRAFKELLARKLVKTGKPQREGARGRKSATYVITALGRKALDKWKS